MSSRHVVELEEIGTGNIVSSGSDKERLPRNPFGTANGAKSSWLRNIGVHPALHP